MADSGSRRQSEHVLMGRIGAAHGIKGEVRIQSFCANPLDIAAYKPLQTNRSDVPLRIISARLQKNMVVARIEGVNDRNAAERLNGTELFVSRELLPDDAEDDDFYIADLIGLDVQSVDGRPIGKIIHIENYGAGDIVELRFNSGKTELFAFTAAIFPKVDIAAGIVTFEPPFEIIVEGEE